MSAKTDNNGKAAPPIDPSGAGAKGTAGNIALDVYRQAIEHVPVAASITDTNANILYANPAFERLTGYPEAELVGHNESVLSDKATPIEIYKDLWATITSGETWKGRLVNRRKDGSTYLADLTVVPVFDADGGIIHYLGMHRDVTDLHQLERKVKNQDALFSSVVEAAPVLIMLLNTTGDVVLSNPAYKQLRRDLGGADLSEKFVEAFQESLGTDIQGMCDQGFDFSAVEVRIDVHQDEQRWYACTATKVREQDMSAAGYFSKDDRCGVLLVASDITLQRRRYEQARTNAVRALMAEQQMVQGMREVISGAIFQLQGPLNVMSAASQMMERQEGAAGALAAPINEVLTAGNAALDRLKAAMPRIADEPVGPLNVNELVREVLDVSIEGLLREGIFVDWRPAASLPNVPGRANAIRSTLKNLLDNAILAIKDGGDGREIVIVTSVTSGGDVKLELRDSGTGLDDALKLKIYEPFFTAWKKTRARPGMGLVLARKVVADQGGSLEIENLMGGGCKVDVVFAAASLGHGPGRQEHKKETAHHD